MLRVNILIEIIWHIFQQYTGHSYVEHASYLLSLSLPVSTRNVRYVSSVGIKFIIMHVVLLFFLISEIFFSLYYQQSEGLQSIFKLMCGRDTVTWWGVHPAVSFQVSWKSKGQHLFSLLLYSGCSSGSNSGLRWSSSLVCFPIFHGWRHIRGVSKSS
jgi:hypothetical protein